MYTYGTSARKVGSTETYYTYADAIRRYKERKKRKLAKKIKRISKKTAGALLIFAGFSVPFLWNVGNAYNIITLLSYILASGLWAGAIIALVVLGLVLILK